MLVRANYAMEVLFSQYVWMWSFIGTPSDESFIVVGYV
jgi:hypothetical protein